MMEFLPEATGTSKGQVKDPVPGVLIIVFPRAARDGKVLNL
jgi:hypothetical protein